MARLWRSVVILGLCFAAVTAMRIYLNRQVEVARSTTSGSDSAGTVSTR